MTPPDGPSEVPLENLGAIDWSGYDLQQKAAWVEQGSGARAIDPTHGALDGLGTEFRASDDRVRKTLKGMQVGWKGTAASSASEALNRVAAAGGAGGDASADGTVPVGSYGQSFDGLKNRFSYHEGPLTSWLGDWAPTVRSISMSTPLLAGAGIGDQIIKFGQNFADGRRADGLLQSHEMAAHDAVGRFPTVAGTPSGPTVGDAGGGGGGPGRGGGEPGGGSGAGDDGGGADGRGSGANGTGGNGAQDAPSGTGSPPDPSATPGPLPGPQTPGRPGPDAPGADGTTPDGADGGHDPNGAGGSPDPTTGQHQGPGSPSPHGGADDPATTPHRDASDSQVDSAGMTPPGPDGTRATPAPTYTPPPAPSPTPSMPGGPIPSPGLFPGTPTGSGIGRVPAIPAPRSGVEFGSSLLRNQPGRVPGTSEGFGSRNGSWAGEPTPRNGTGAPGRYGGGGGPSEPAPGRGGAEPVVGRSGTGAGAGAGGYGPMGGAGAGRGSDQEHRNRYLLPSSEAFDVDLPHTPPVLGAPDPDEDER